MDTLIQLVRLGQTPAADKPPHPLGGDAQHLCDVFCFEIEGHTNPLCRASLKFSMSFQYSFRAFSLAFSSDLELMSQ